MFLVKFLRNQAVDASLKMAAKNTTHYLQTFCKLNSFLDNRKASLTRYVKEEKFTDSNFIAKN